MNLTITQPHLLIYTSLTTIERNFVEKMSNKWSSIENWPILLQ
jgi:hypothetical protein